jgi:phytoene dehydrogenase-like protein
MNSQATSHRRVTIIGAGMGGLAASIILRKRGYHVTVLEARSRVGGLAGGLKLDGLQFDGGPYVLLDRPGLEWAFEQLGIDLEEQLSPLKRLDPVYQVEFPNHPPLCFRASLTETADSFEALGPGTRQRYLDYIARVGAVYRQLQYLQTTKAPGLLGRLNPRFLRHVPFLLSSAGSILAKTGLPEALTQSLGIWTHIAGQSPYKAPSPLTFVPAIIHSVGAWLPKAGTAAVPAALEQQARNLGVQFRLSTKVTKICTKNRRVIAVQTESEEQIPSSCVISNAAGVATYLDLMEHQPPPRARKSLARLPLQSPGVSAYLAVKSSQKPQQYLRFLLPSESQSLCRAYIEPCAVFPELEKDGWRPARLFAPMRHEECQAMSADQQQSFLDRIIAEPWWRKEFEDVKVLKTFIPQTWGRDYHLYHDSMNPVMTAKFMRQGRLAHRSPYCQGLYLVGSSTHPGQWISFCAISGILAGNMIEEDCP